MIGYDTGDGSKTQCAAGVYDLQSPYDLCIMFFGRKISGPYGSPDGRDGKAETHTEDVQHANDGTAGKCQAAHYIAEQQHDSEDHTCFKASDPICDLPEQRLCDGEDQPHRTDYECSGSGTEPFCRIQYRKMGKSRVCQNSHAEAGAAYENPHGNRHSTLFFIIRTIGFGLYFQRFFSAVGKQPFFFGCVSHEYSDYDNENEQSAAFDQERRAYVQIGNHGVDKRRHEDGRKAASHGAKPQSKSLTADEPVIHQHRYRNHRAETVTETGDSGSSAEKNIVVGQSVQRKSDACAECGDDSACAQAEYLIIFTDTQHSYERNDAADIYKKGGLAVGKAVFLYQIGQIHGKAVGDDAHGYENQHSSKNAYDPCVVNIFDFLYHDFKSTPLQHDFYYIRRSL